MQKKFKKILGALSVLVLGIPPVGVTICGNFGPLITGNRGRCEGCCFLDRLRIGNYCHYLLEKSGYLIRFDCTIIIPIIIRILFRNY